MHKRSILILLNYQREIPPFMQMVIEEAQVHFSRIYYITPTLYYDNSASCKFENVEIVQVPRSVWYYALLRAPGYLFRREVRENILRAFREKKISLAFWKQLLVHVVCADVMWLGAGRCIKRDKIQQERTLVLAVWFSVEAYCAGRLKQRYPELKAASWAHSFEVNPARNAWATLQMGLFKHQYLDHVCFIAEKMKCLYSACWGREDKIYPEKMTVEYLGCCKRGMDSVNCTASRDGSFRIVSCSSVVSCKRLDLLAEALRRWNWGPVQWTHIGGGQLFKELQRKCEDVERENALVKIELLGKQDNCFVHEYYQKYECDLFVNISAVEGLPVSVMECMAYAIPVVATDVGGTGEIVNSRNGLLIAADFTSQELLDALGRFRNMPPMQIQVYRQAAFMTWWRDFNAKNNMNHFFQKLQHD